MVRKQNRRYRLIADVKLQGLLIVRVIAYWFTCQLMMVGTMLGFAFLQGPSEGISAAVKTLMVPAIFVSAMVLPIAIFDMLVFSNRFAGPMLNFRRKFRELAQEGTTGHVHFRAGDYYPDLRENFNQLLDQLNKPAENQPAEQDFDEPEHEELEPVGNVAAY